MKQEFWSGVFTFLMMVSIILELLTPAMGGFTLAAALLGFGSVYMAFQGSPSFGYIMIAVNLALFPLTLWLGVRIMGQSPLVHNAEISGSTQTTPDAPQLLPLLGKVGRTVTPLRPGGTAMIEDRKSDVVTQGKFVEPGTDVKVILVEGNKVVVEALQA